MLLGIKSDDYTSTLVNVDRWLYFLKFLFGGLAQLARAPALQAGGHRFESDILHERKQAIIDILEENQIKNLSRAQQA